METIETASSNTLALPCFFIGMGAGIALAVLFAPNSGAETRRFIGRKFDKAEASVKAKAEAGEDYIRSHAEDLRDRFNDVVEAATRPASAPSSNGGQL